jgi:hypothetical protein
MAFEANMMKHLGMLFFLSSASLNWQTQGAPTVISYQGNLRDNGQAATGLYDVKFSLSDSETGGSYVGPTITNAAVPVSNGLFTVALDFGLDVFSGQSRWLEIAVCTNGSVLPCTTLSPRTPIQPTPYALRAQTGGSETLKLLGGTTVPLPYTGYDFSFGFPTGSATNAVTNLYTFERTSVPKTVQDVRILLMNRPTNNIPVFVRAEVWGVTAAAYSQSPCAFLQEFATFRRAITVETNMSSASVANWISISLLTNGVDLGVNQDELLALAIRGQPDATPSCMLYWEGLGRAIVRDK